MIDLLALTPAQIASAESRARMVELDVREDRRRRNTMAATPPNVRLYVRITVGLVEDGRLRVDRDLVI